MIASRGAKKQEAPQVTVRCRVAGGPWIVLLRRPGVPDVELGSYENPAVAREDAAKLRQFLALMILDEENGNHCFPNAVPYNTSIGQSSGHEPLPMKIFV